MTELQRLARRLADDYEFECQGGPLRNCTEWRALCEAIDTLAVAPPSGASPQAETDEDMGDGWYVTVGRWGESLVTIEQRCLSGKADFTDDDAALIRGAAKHLQQFIGQPAPVSSVEPEPATTCHCLDCEPLTNPGPKPSEDDIDRLEMQHLATCATNGHVYGHTGACIFCGEPKSTPVEPAGASEPPSECPVCGSTSKEVRYLRYTLNGRFCCIDSWHYQSVSPVEPTTCPKCRSNTRAYRLAVADVIDGRMAGMTSCRDEWHSRLPMVSPVEPEPPYRETPAGDRIFRHTCGTPEDDGECMACGQIDCPDREPLHYHHDGCPCCSQKPTVEPEPCVWRWDHASEVWRSSCPTMDYGDEDAKHDTPTMGWKVCPYCTHPVRLVPSEETK